MRRIILFLIFLLLPLNSRAETSTICPSGCDYTCLQNWESVEDNEEVTEPEIAEITEGFEDAAVQLDGWNGVTADNYIKIYTTSAARHNGKWDTNAYRMVSSSINYTVIVSQDLTVKIDGLQIKNTYVDSSGVIGSNNEITTNVEFSNSIVDGDGYNANRGIGMWSAGTWDIWNVIVFGAKNGIRHQSEGTVNIYNCTVSDCSEDGIESDNLTTSVYNTAVFNTPDDFQDTFTTITNCACDDADCSVDISPGATETDDWADAFVDYANGDFHITSGSVLKDVGMTDSGSGLFSDDIDSQSRPGIGSSVWDIGADEYSSGTTIRGAVIRGAVIR